MRLIRSGACPPAFNLAFDEALLRTGADALRLYAWDPPGYSLGFFQRAAEHAVPAGFVLVRRPTGGGAIAHTGELTISWTGRRRRVEGVYEQTNAIVAAALARFGVRVVPGAAEPEAAPAGLCFDSHTRYDLLGDGRKVFGSAQRRGGERFLMHGTLVLEPNRWSVGSISVRELAGRVVTRGEMEEAVIAAAGDVLQTALEESRPNGIELAEADRLVSRRYANETWTRRR